VELARPATDSDRAACRALLDDALSGAAIVRGGPALLGAATPESLLARWANRVDACLLVGEYEGAVVGVLGATVAPARGPLAMRAFIQCCYVETLARGVGVGSALMELAVEWAASRGCAEVDALALPGDRATKQRLEAAGFTARLLTLSRRLG
jgi:GNAT superfamily N-acetyltransferase